MKKKLTSSPRDASSALWQPSRHFMMMLAVIFIAEVLVMYILPFVVPAATPGWLVAVLDALLLTVLAAPILWRGEIRPLRDVVQEKTESYRLVLENAADAIVTIDDQGVIHTFNAAAEKAFGYAASEVVGQNIKLLMPPPYCDEHDSHLERYLQTGQRKIIGMSREVPGRHRDGTTFSIEIHVSELHTHGRRMYTGILRDISERKQSEQQLQDAAKQLKDKNAELERLAATLADMNTELAHLARIDGLTKVLTRGAWEESAHLEHDRFQRAGSPYAILLIDVDHFKLFNDNLGHPAGDVCLRKVAKSIAHMIRATDIVGRFGGEEFAVLLPETDQAGAVELAERVRAGVWNLELTHPASPTADHVTVSVGAATTRDGLALEQVISAADVALYRAKGSGRNRVCQAEGESVSAGA